MKKIINTALSMPYSAGLVLAASLAALATAFIAQYVFGLIPCVLCVLQRWPYAIALVLSLALLVIRKKANAPVGLLLTLCGVAFTIGGAIAAFHVGVEQHWWSGTPGCLVHPIAEGSIEDMRKSLLAKVTEARCDEISWTLFGLSMTVYNVAMSFALAVFSFIASRR